jgi:hypothetical protein
MEENEMRRRIKMMAGAIAAAMLSNSGADAAIRCEGNFQIVNGSSISTPFCQDQNLAAHARASGIPVSDARVRMSPEAKRQACLSSASDSATCADYLGD